MTRRARTPPASPARTTPTANCAPRTPRASALRFRGRVARRSTSRCARALVSTSVEDQPLSAVEDGDSEARTRGQVQRVIEWATTRVCTAYRSPRRSRYAIQGHGRIESPLIPHPTVHVRVRVPTGKRRRRRWRLTTGQWIDFISHSTNPPRTCNHIWRTWHASHCVRASAMCRAIMRMGQARTGQETHHLPESFLTPTSISGVGYNTRHNQDRHCACVNRARCYGAPARQPGTARSPIGGKTGSRAPPPPPPPLQEEEGREPNRPNPSLGGGVLGRGPSELCGPHSRVYYIRIGRPCRGPACVRGSIFFFF